MSEPGGRCTPRQLQVERSKDESFHLYTSLMQVYIFSTVLKLKKEAYTTHSALLDAPARAQRSSDAGPTLPGVSLQM